MLYFISNQAHLFSKYESLTVEGALDKIKELDILGLDIETSGLNPLEDRILLIQLGNKNIQIIFDIKSFGYKIPKLLIDFLNEKKRTYVGHNLKFDLNFLYTQSVRILNVFDTFLAETILYNGLLFGDDGIIQKNLAALAEKYCNITLNKSVRSSFAKEIINEASIEYSALDIIPLLDIREAQIKLGIKFDLLEAFRLDNAFLPALVYIERCGIKLDPEKWALKMQVDLQALEDTKGKLAKYLYDNKFYNYVGHIDMFTGHPTCKINWSSSQQVIPFFESLGINCTVRVKGEVKKSVQENVIAPQAKQFPIIDLYLDYQEACQRVKTFGKTWINAISPKTGRLHTSFKQLVITGRMSCGDKTTEWSKNLQNVPGDDITRNSFVVEPGNVFIDCDYSSQEQIVMANQSQEPSLLQFYKNGFTDMHSFVAFLMYPLIRPCKQEDLTNDDLTFIQTNFPKERKTAKSCGFAIRLSI